MAGVLLFSKNGGINTILVRGSITQCVCLSVCTVVMLGVLPTPDLQLRPVVHFAPAALTTEEDECAVVQGIVQVQSPLLHYRHFQFDVFV